MYHTYIKRIIKIEVPGATPEETLENAKKQKFEERVISDSFFIEDDNELVLAKEKIIYGTTGKSFMFRGEKGGQ
jgi:hypothetical protein